MLFTLTFAVPLRNEGEACNIQSINYIAMVKLESMGFEGNLKIHHIYRAKHRLIKDRDSGQIEALDRDYVKASSLSQSANVSSGERISPVLIFVI